MFAIQLGRICAFCTSLGLLASCSAPTQGTSVQSQGASVSGQATAATTSGNSATVLAAFESEVHLTGSCRVSSVICRDFWNKPGSDLEIIERDQCMGLGMRWANVGCTATGRLGGCKSNIDANGAYLIQWYYAADYARDARILCESDGPSEWIP
jgi:hypothetical protein